MPKEGQITIALDVKNVHSSWLQLHHIIEDRGSKYSVTAARVESNADIKEFLQTLKKSKKYAKATHHSYAVRVQKDGQIHESKQDDGETGAGMVILRQMQKKNVVNVCIVVTRWFGGTMLFADRFKHVQEATQAILEQNDLY